MKNIPPHDDIPPEMLDAAAAWLARRDRGLTPAEQDQYMQWLSSDPRHAEAFGRHAATLERMMRLYEWTPAHDTEPNPDLFAPPLARHRAWTRWAGAGLAAAAAITILFTLTRPAAPPVVAPAVAKTYLHVNERMALPDGSRVELKDGTRLVVQYSESERRVRLTGGEAHFTVWKDPLRPFVVDAAGIEVRAVGTAFNVRLQPDEVQVLVTEGRVQVDGPAAIPGAPLAMLTGGERAVVPLSTAAQPLIERVTADEIGRELAWQAPFLQFDETPLAVAVGEFNRLNRHQLELADPTLGTQLIGGTFRPDNVEGFVRLLNTALGVQAEPRGPDRTVLRRAP